MQTTNYRITFPSVHGTGGQAFNAEANAPSEALAVRAVLEACAAQGVPLHHVVLSTPADLQGARLDNLQLIGCKLDGLDLSGASLRGATIKASQLFRVVADGRTHMDGAVLADVAFDGCKLDDLQAPNLNASALRFVHCSLNRWNVPYADFEGLGALDTSVAGWKAHMAAIRHSNVFAAIEGSADMTANQKGGMRACSRSSNREAAAHYFAGLEAQDSAARA